MTEAQNIDISALIEGKSADQALAIVESLLTTQPENASLLVEKGKLLWRLNRKGEAMSAYEAAALIDPDGPAKLLLEHSNSIMDFFNPDLLNP